jgi:hypothetical protein
MIREELLSCIEEAFTPPPGYPDEYKCIGRLSVVSHWGELAEKIVPRLIATIRAMRVMVDELTWIRVMAVRSTTFKTQAFHRRIMRKDPELNKRADFRKWGYT